MIKRYEIFSASITRVTESANGEWVSYEHHIAEIAKVQSLNTDYLYAAKCANAEVAALREKLQTIEAETIERCAKLCDEQLSYDEDDPCEFFASVIRKMTPIQQSKDSAQPDTGEK